MKERGYETGFLSPFAAGRIAVPCWAFMPGFWDHSKRRALNGNPRSLFLNRSNNSRLEAQSCTERIKNGTTMDSTVLTQHTF